MKQEADLVFRRSIDRHSQSPSGIYTRIFPKNADTSSVWIDDENIAKRQIIIIGTIANTNCRHNMITSGPIYTDDHRRTIADTVICTFQSLFLCIGVADIYTFIFLISLAIFPTGPGCRPFYIIWVQSRIVINRICSTHCCCSASTVLPFFIQKARIILLGFGLRMSTEDVSAFLIKALHEPDINPKNPFELMCWYCYQHHYGYAEYRQLKESFEKIPPKRHRTQQIYSEGTVSIRNSYTNIHDDSVFLSRLAQMKTMENTPLFSYTARQQFDKLYHQTRTIIADYLNRDEEEQLKRQISEYLRANAYNTKFSEADKAIHIEKMRSGIRVYSEEDISAGDVEKVICSAIPMDRNGNLGKSSFSSLNAQFQGRRFSRQHITEILQHNIDVDRFDLITLNFFIYSQKTTELPDPKTRFLKFCDDTNAILRDCSMGEILTTNPYECFLMMCMLSEDPLGTYADVIEMSYDSSDR